MKKLSKKSTDQLSQTSENFRWAASVAGFGMLLRNSEFKSDANYNNIIKLAESSKGKDEKGYRQECINMMKTMRSLTNPDIVNKN